ncbi:TonB-dependent receptor domain-containing protein [Xanthomonas theicola]|uniref:TonB-dependent receptor domain-containing protein n=1 Tax=Xanthomonas theicola TaxID=56464 RepID=UPI00360C0B55
MANFILKKDFQGVDASARYGASSRGDMRSRSVDALAGRNFADNRGNVTVYGFYEREPDSVSGQDRPWTASGYPMYTRNNRNQRYWISNGNRNINNAEDAQLILGGRHYAMTADGRLRDPVLGPDGYVNAAPVRLANGADTLGSLLTGGGEYGGRYDSWYLAVPSDRFASRATFNFDVSDSLRPFANLGYSQTRSQSAWRALSAFGSEAVPADSPFITEAMRAANGGAITDPVYFARHFDAELGQGRSDYRRQLLQGVIGLEGDFTLGARAWNYSAYYSNGRTRQRNRDLDTVAYSRYYLALDSTTGADGSAVCRSTLTDPGNGCVPLNPFKRLTRAEIGYLRYSSDWAITRMTQQVVSAYASGGVFDLPGGEAQIALGGEYRKERNSIGAVPQYDPASPAYDASLGTTQLPLVGQYDVKELYSELHLPLLAERPFAQRLGMDAAVRVSDYNVAGRTITNKFGFDWAPVRDVTLRGTYGKAVRAPNIGELYTASSIGGMWISDPCNSDNLRYRTDRSQYTAANCAQLDPSDKSTYWLYRDIITKGNLELANETAKTRTLGIVLRPRFLEDVSLSVDYHTISTCAGRSIRSRRRPSSTSAWTRPA